MSGIAIETDFSTQTAAENWITSNSTGYSESEEVAAYIATFYNRSSNLFGITARFGNINDGNDADATTMVIKGASFTSVNVTDAGTLQFLTEDSVTIDSLSRTELRTAANITEVDNTADLDKPISTDMQAALDLKVTAEDGKGLSTNDYTTDEKTKLAALDSKNKGYYASESALLAVYPNSDSSIDITTGSFAYVEVTDDNGDTATYLYSYDADALLWTQGDQVSSSTLSGAEIKTLYEGQEDTNAYTDDEKSKLEDIEAGAQVNVIETINGSSPATGSTDIEIDADTVGLGDYAGTTPDTLPLNDVQKATVTEMAGDVSQGRTIMFHTTSLKSLEYEPLPGGTIKIKINDEARKWRIVNETSSAIQFTVACFFEDDPTTSNDAWMYEYGKDITVKANSKSGWHPLQRNGLGFKDYEIQKGNHANNVIIDKTNNKIYTIEYFGLTDGRFIISVNIATDAINLG